MMKRIVLYATLALFVVGFILPLHAQDLPALPRSVVITGSSDETVEMLFFVPKALNSKAGSCHELSFDVIASEPTGEKSITTTVMLNAGQFQKVELDLGLLVNDSINVNNDTVDVIVEVTNIRVKGLCRIQPSLLRFTDSEGGVRDVINPLLVEGMVLFHCYSPEAPISQVGCNG